MSAADYKATSDNVSRYYGIDPNVMRFLFNSESGWNANPSGGVSGGGIAQFIPATAERYGVDRMDPTSSIWGAGAYMNDILKRNGGDYAAALREYGTTGPGASQRTIDASQSVVANAQPYGSDSSGGIFSGILGAFGNFFGGSLTGEAGNDEPMSSSEQKAANEAAGRSADGSYPDRSLAAVGGYFQRTAVVVLGIVFIAAALFVLGRKA